MGLELAEGRNFNKHLPGDTASIIINEVAAKIMNMENPVGQKLTEPFDITIIGVVKDFHFKSAHSRIEPLIMFTGRNNYNRTFIKIDGNNVSESVSQVKAVWNKLNQEQAMPYRFLDEDYEKLYQSEERTSKIFTNFTLLAFLISGLGLFGLSSFTAEQRLKEISIRKVMGATSLKLFWLVSTDLTRLSIISILIAVPVGWYWMNSWLEGFAYRIEISPVIFIVASLVGIIITFLTVSFQSLKVSASNPVNHLRNE
jgi:putative ABC transport system permease protein